MLPDNALRTITAQRLRDFFTEFIHAFIMVPRGNFLLGTQYEKNDLVVFNGSSFYCKQANNDKPVSNTDFWGLLASKGDTGAPKWRGAWNAATAYAIGDSVSQNGNSYISKTAHTNQAVTNTTHWDIVAAKGESGAQIQNFGGSLLQNGALETGTIAGWSRGELNGLNEGLNILRLPVVASSSLTSTTFNTRVAVRHDRLYKLSVTSKLLVGVMSFRFNLKDIFGNNANNGLTVSPYSYSSGNGQGYANTDFEKKEIYFGGRGNNQFCFGSNVSSFELSIVHQFNAAVELYGLVLHEVSISEPVPSNLAWLPDGQAVFDVANPLKKGTYINSIVGIVWHTVKEITLQPNGTSVVFNLRRTYKFTWSAMYNDGVTIVSQPPATVNANTDALLTLTGAAGKTLTIQIQQIA
jgi:hypothetical protein